MATKAAPKETEINILEVKTGAIEFCVIGTTPLILNRMSEKAKQELLMPKGRKTAADKASNLKHVPLEEFRASPYKSNNPKAETLLHFPASGFKAACATAALDIPGAKKAQIGRLVQIEGFNVPIYGIPQLYMSIVRSSDINHTPDVRTRAIVPEWCTRIKLIYVMPILRQQPLLNLISASGLFVGVGDYRAEKGKSNFGSFRICSANDPDYLRIIKTGGRAAQQAAMRHPQCFDPESEELLSWFDQEVDKRGHKGIESWSKSKDMETV